jgi:WD40 repeat protein
VPAVAFSPDGKTLALGNYDHTAKLRDTQTGRPIKVFAGHTKLVRAVAFSPDGKTLATGSWDQTVKLWDLATGAERLELKWPVERLFVLSFSPTGQWLLAAEEYLRIWDAATGKEQRAQGRAGVYVEWAAFADDHWFLTGDNHGTVRVWSVATGAQRANFGAMAGVRRLAFSPKARRLAVATHFRHDISLYDFTLQAPSAEERERFAALLVKLDDDDYAVREAAGKEVLTLGFIMEPELRRLMKDAPSAEVRIRSRRLRKELLNKPQATLDGHTADVESLAFSPDGRLLASCSMDGTIRLWNVSEHKEVARLTPVVP